MPNPSKLVRQCRECRFKDTCQNKIMEAYGYLQPKMQSNIAEMVQPMIKKKDLRDIKIDTNTTVTIDLEELKEQLKLDQMKYITGMFKNGA